MLSTRMLVYIALTFALALSAIAKEECSKDCKAEFWDKAEKDTPNESCEAGKLWRACLNKQQIAGCPNVEYTQELDGACHQTDFKDCSKMSKCSTLDKMQGNVSKARKCRLAKKWRSCLAKFNAHCNVEIPYEVTDTQAKNC